MSLSGASMLPESWCNGGTTFVRILRRNLASAVSVEFRPSRGHRQLGSGPADVRRPRPFRTPVAKLELDAVTLAQHVDALAVNGGGMKEHLFAGLISNKAESFVRSQCLDGSCHWFRFSLEAAGIGRLFVQFLVAGGGFEPPTFGL